MSSPSSMAGNHGQALLAAYDDALPHVYGYLLSRCGRVALAEDLTSETFLAAASAASRGQPTTGVSTAWLVGVARHKLADHWRRLAREERGLESAGEGQRHEDPWEAELDAIRARSVLEKLVPSYRAALTLRYLDDLPVPEIADLLHRTVHSTEGLLVRARSAFRRAYTAGEVGDA